MRVKNKSGLLDAIQRFHWRKTLLHCQSTWVHGSADSSINPHFFFEFGPKKHKCYTASNRGLAPHKNFGWKLTLTRLTRAL